jgi:hypothetical protein
LEFVKVLTADNRSTLALIWRTVALAGGLAPNIGLADRQEMRFRRAFNECGKYRG